MIFYFSGTGNSEFAAKQLAKEDELVVNMAEARKSKKYQYELEKGEAVGFVFPVYFYTVPSFVERFVKKLKLSNATYVYAVITCGGGISKAGVVFQNILKANGLQLSYVESLLMPDNSMLFYQIPKAEQGKERVVAAKNKLQKIKKDIERKQTKEIGTHAVMSKLLGMAYKKCQNTSKFWVEDDRCVGCGLCERNCPESVIQLVNERPTWNKKKCCKCSGCINGCPKEAIQYGKMTKKRNRYHFERVGEK